MYRWLLVVLIACSTTVDAETYVGEIGGDRVQMDIELDGNAVRGSMRDSHQHYAIEGTLANDELQATATEATTGVVFQLRGTRLSDALDLRVTPELLGEISEQPLYLTRTDGSSAMDGRAAAGAAATAPGALADGERDPALIGRWIHESNYQSGSGDSFFAANTRQSMLLLADGRVLNGGADVSVSGDNYFGQSAGAGGGEADIRWTTRDNHIYFSGTENGVAQTVDVGRYYVENGRMLITGNNGTKLLLTKGE